MAKILYNYIFKRSSSFALAIVVTSMFFERAYDHLCEAFYEKVNEGRLWRDIKHKYENKIEPLTTTSSDEINDSAAQGVIATNEGSSTGKNKE